MSKKSKQAGAWRELLGDRFEALATGIREKVASLELTEQAWEIILLFAVESMKHIGGQTFF